MEPISGQRESSVNPSIGVLREPTNSKGSMKGTH
jgi:hypothetical protein